MIFLDVGVDGCPAQSGLPDDLGQSKYDLRCGAGFGAVLLLSADTVFGIINIALQMLFNSSQP